MRKYIFMAIAGVVVIAAVSVYFIMNQAAHETDRITSGEEQKLSESQIKELAQKPTDDLQTALQAGKQLAEMDPKQRIAVFEKQLESETLAVRLNAAKELMTLDAQGVEGANALLGKLADEGHADKDVRALAQKHLGAKALDGLKDKALIEAAIAQLSDPRVGVRWAAVDALAAVKCPECKEALRKVANEDADEDLKMVAEMAIEEESEGEEGGGE